MRHDAGSTTTSTTASAAPPSTAPASRWGRAKGFGGRVPTLALTIPIGIALGLGLGVAIAASGLVDADPILIAVVFGLALSIPCNTLCFVLAVDRNTLSGAADRPEETVEHTWFQRAHAGAATDLLLTVGVVAFITSFVPFEAPVSLVLAAVILFVMAATGVRYLLLRRQG